MKKILVPTDFSVNALNALTYARFLFEKEEVQFTLIHAYEPGAIQMVGKSPIRLSKIYESIRIETEKKLKFLVHEISQNNVNTLHQYDYCALEGHLGGILQEMNLDAHDFLIMGSKGATGLKSLFWGSVTSSVVQKQLPLPILVVPEDVTFKKLQRIAFATNFDKPYVISELQPLIDLHTLWDANLNMIQVYYEPLLTDFQQQNLDHLELLLSTIKHEYHVIPNFSTIEEAIPIFTKEMNIDILSLINYKHSFFEKIVREPVLKKLSYHSKIPLLILPTEN